MPLEQIIVGGESRARNRTILNIFSFVNIGERAGSGFPLILKAAKEYNYPEPELFNRYNPDVTKLTVYIKKITSEEKLTFESGNLTIESENLTFEGGNLTFEDENLTIESENLTIESKTTNELFKIVNNSNHKNKIKEKLIKIIVLLFEKDYWSRNNVKQILNCSSGTSFNLINYLLELDMVEPVSGHGKGKYKFK